MLTKRLAVLKVSKCLHLWANTRYPALKTYRALPSIVISECKNILTANKMVDIYAFAFIQSGLQYMFFYTFYLHLCSSMLHQLLTNKLIHITHTVRPTVPTVTINDNLTFLIYRDNTVSYAQYYLCPTEGIVGPLKSV